MNDQLWFMRRDGLESILPLVDRVLDWRGYEREFALGRKRCERADQNLEEIEQLTEDRQDLASSSRSVRNESFPNTDSGVTDDTDCILTNDVDGGEHTVSSVFTESFDECLLRGIHSRSDILLLFFLCLVFVLADLSADTRDTE